jgi:tetratricopeptide (TPR) repeat protein
MGLTTIVIIAVLFVVIVTVTIILVKSLVKPQKISSIQKLIKEQKYPQAQKLAKGIIAKNQRDYLAHYWLGKAYLADNKSELAFMEYKTVNENALFNGDIPEIEFRRTMAELYKKFNQPQDALKEYLLLTKLDPTNAENFYQVGRIYEQQNRYDLALGFMQKCAMIDKKHAKAHAEIGLMLYRTKQFNEAKKEIDIALKLSPDTYSSYYYLGKILKDAKDLQGAIKAFEKAQRDPDVKQKAIIEHGSCYMLAGRNDNALVDFQRAIELDKDNSHQETLYARYFLASCYEKSRKIDKAIEQWEEIYKRNKGFRDVSAKLSEYKDLQANDYLKDYLTCSNEEFPIICRNATVKAMNLQVLSCDMKKWGCQITGVNKSDESWMAVRKQVLFIRFYREPEPIDESQIHESLDLMKSMNSVKAFLFSSSGFNTAAKRFAENRPIELIEKQKLEALLSKAGS